MGDRDYGFGKFIQLLVSRRFPDGLRYGGTILLVGAFVALRLALPLSGTSVVLFIPPVLAASLAFGRGPGLLATGLTAVATVLLLIEPMFAWSMPASEGFSMLVYVAVGCGIAVLAHVLRATMGRALAAERSKTVLLEELAHRTKNDLQMVASILSLQVRTIADPEARFAVEGAATRVLTVAKLHNRLRSDGSDSVVDIRAYLDDLCGDLRQTFGALRPVVLTVESDPVVLGSVTAAPIGLVVNELVTNAYKYAFPDNREGRIDVCFQRSEAVGGFVLTVRDNGVGWSGTKDGLGSRIVRLLAQQLGGSLERAPGNPGTVTTVSLPLR